MVSDLVSPPVWFHWLRHTADRARGSVAHADAPLPHEHATAFAFGEHIDFISARMGEADSVSPHNSSRTRFTPRLENVDSSQSARPLSNLP